MELPFLNVSDETLISKALDGSQRSWERLVRRHETMVYNYCVRMTRDSSDAGDLLQEVFLAVYRHLPSYRGQGQFKGWMMRIAVNKTMDLLRQRQRSPRLSTDDAAGEAVLEWQAPDHHNPDQVYEQITNNRRIHMLLQALPPEQRLVVELKFFQHCTFEEIAIQTSCPVNTVKTRLYTSLQKLKDTLEESHVM
ncbi:MAG: sigma-70 family RNA polymerase sigma factor [Pseudomonadota bacterium]